MARFRSTVTDKGAEAWTRFAAAGRQIVLVSAAAGDGVCDEGVSPNTLTGLVHPVQVDAQIGEKNFVDGPTSYMRIPVQVTNAGLEAPVFVREVATFALDENGTPFMFTYSWLEGDDSDNVLPACSFLDHESVMEEADTVHIHDVAVLATAGENGSVVVELGAGSFVTMGQMVAYAAPILHTHGAAEVVESTGESVEATQRSQDYDIAAIKEQLDTGFTGTTVTHTFAAAQISQWKGYNGTGLPEGILDTAANRLYL